MGGLQTITSGLILTIIHHDNTRELSRHMQTILNKGVGEGSILPILVYMYLDQFLCWNRSFVTGLQAQSLNRVKLQWSFSRKLNLSWVAKIAFH